MGERGPDATHLNKGQSAHTATPFPGFLQSDSFPNARIPSRRTPTFVTGSSFERPGRLSGRASTLRPHSVRTKTSDDDYSKLDRLRTLPSFLSRLHSFYYRLLVVDIRRNLTLETGVQEVAFEDIKFWRNHFGILITNYNNQPPIPSYHHSNRFSTIRPSAFPSSSPTLEDYLEPK